MLHMENSKNEQYRNDEAVFAFPSAVTAAKTVEEYGAQATSPTALPRSNVNIGSLATNDNM